MAADQFKDWQNMDLMTDIIGEIYIAIIFSGVKGHAFESHLCIHNTFRAHKYGLQCDVSHVFSKNIQLIPASSAICQQYCQLFLP